jgi:hypothetical protein
MQQVRYTGNRAQDTRTLVTLCARIALAYHDSNMERAEVFSDALTAMAFLSRMMPQFSMQDPRDLIALFEQPIKAWFPDGPNEQLVHRGRPTEVCHRFASGLGLEGA